jgi:hypothetical protein
MMSQYPLGFGQLLLALSFVLSVSCRGSWGRNDVVPCQSDVARNGASYRLTVQFNYRANVPTRPRDRVRHSLPVVGCSPALPPQEDTPLQHNRSPGSPGSLLRGLLVVTTVRLPPTSRRQLIRAHHALVGRPSKSSCSKHSLLPHEMLGKKVRLC